MFDVTNFLMRWLFLSNLVQDVAEIQTLPYNPQQIQLQNVEQAVSLPVRCEEEWRENCLLGILSYPPGTQRLLVMDAMRAELVNKLAVSLQQADHTLERYEAARRRRNQQNVIDAAETASFDGGEDPFLDADVEILETFGREALSDNETESDSPDQGQAMLVISNNATVRSEAGSPGMSTHSEPMLVEEAFVCPSTAEVEDAQKTVRLVRDYLPQLVSVVLKSPPAFEPNLLDPIEKIRKVIINRCVEDANWGVDMCWLLEAEVGRAWKTLFEHRQQTGRRLIVVLPAEKAAVLAKIGSEKREAFDLLQDVEQATAYGYTITMDEELFYQGYQPYTNYHPHRKGPDDAQVRLPSSISLRRCSHYGDTMHFIDRLTKLSMDLRRVPTIHRHVSFNRFPHVVLSLVFLTPLKPIRLICKMAWKR
jgi:hypothetical protein